jgi:translation initiation factor RLI1
MGKKMALADFSRCQPERCESGLCLAAQACQRRLLRQEKPWKPPMSDPALCRGCADCLRACALKAIRMVSM